MKDQKALLKNLRDKYKKDFAALSAQYLNRPLAEQEEVLKGIHPYAEEMANAFGVAGDFTGQYQSSDLLKERRDWRGIIVVGVLCLVFGVLIKLHGFPIRKD